MNGLSTGQSPGRVVLSVRTPRDDGDLALSGQCVCLNRIAEMPPASSTTTANLEPRRPRPEHPHRSEKHDGLSHSRDGRADLRRHDKGIDDFEEAACIALDLSRGRGQASRDRVPAAESLPRNRSGAAVPVPPPRSWLDRRCLQQAAALDGSSTASRWLGIQALGISPLEAAGGHVQGQQARVSRVGGVLAAMRANSQDEGSSDDLSTEGIRALRRVRQKLVDLPFVPRHEQVAPGAPVTVEVRRVARELTTVLEGIRTEVQALTFDGTIPAPQIVSREGDSVKRSPKTPAGNAFLRNSDFRASSILPQAKTIVRNLEAHGPREGIHPTCEPGVR